MSEQIEIRGKFVGFDGKERFATSSEQLRKAGYVSIDEVVEMVEKLPHASNRDQMEKKAYVNYRDLLDKLKQMKKKQSGS